MYVLSARELHPWTYKVAAEAGAEAGLRLIQAA